MINHLIDYLPIIPVLWRKIPCISPMLIWWQRYFTFYFAPCVCPISHFRPALIICSLPELRWGRRRRGGGRKGENVWGETPSSNPASASFKLWELLWTAVRLLLQEKEMEKQKMLYQQARLHDRGAAEMVLQMISASKGRTHSKLLCGVISGRVRRDGRVMHGLWSSGRLGAMVTVTLQLGISILNGGNILVQQVNSSRHFVWLDLREEKWRRALEPCSLCFGSFRRKCWTTSRRKETSASSRVCLDWWCLAGSGTRITKTELNEKIKDRKKVCFFFFLLSFSVTI